MALATLFISAFVVALSGALMPGPVLLVTVRHSAALGRKVGPLIVVGHALVEIPLMVAIIFGLHRLLTADVFVGVVGVAGGGLLAAMSFFMLRSVPRLHLPDPTEAGTASGPGVPALIAAGATTSLLNPTFPLWWGTVGMKFLADAAAFAPAGYFVFYAGHVLADLAWYAAVSESLHRGRRVFSDRAYRRLVGACAVFLAVFALWFAWDGALRLLGH